VLSWTGRGWLAFMLFMALALACLGVATTQRGEAIALTFAALYTAVGVPVHWFVGTRINSERTPEGRRPLDVHTFNGLPMQHWVFWYPLCSAIVIGLVLAANDEAGWSRTVFIAAVVGVVVYLVVLRRGAARSRPPGSEEGDLLFPGADAAVPRTRRELAAERGWRFEHLARDLPDRWRERYATTALLPQDVLAGEVDGLPFTIFDTPVRAGSTTDRLESYRTVVMVHLPVALPDVQLRPRLLPEAEQLLDDPEDPYVIADLPPWHCDLLPRARGLSAVEAGETDPEMVAESDLPGFADALVTPEVRAQTVRHRLPGWRIHGRDLVFAGLPGRKRDAAYSPGQALAVVTGLVAVARALPSGVVREYGAAPTGELPLAAPEGSDPR
jgi:hypothetical protein